MAASGPWCGDVGLGRLRCLLGWPAEL
jgi:hypothetical protein